MFPLFDFGSFQLSAYSLFTVAALIAVVAGSYWFATRRGMKSSDSLWMLGGMGVAVFVGARLFNVVVNFGWYSDDISRVFSFTASGFSLYGGILFAVLVGWLISYVRQIPLFKFADTVTPFIGIGIALQRVGCFLNGCCFGKETSLPWGVKFPTMSSAHIHQISGDLLGSTTVASVHPTQLYELLAALIGTGIALILIKRGSTNGTAFLVCGIGFSAFRWLNMQFRILPYSESMTNIWYPIFYLSIIVVCTVLLIKISSKKSKSV